MDKYGHKSRLYNCWCRMKSRCNNPNNKDFVYYGAKNIRVCNEWAESYNDFKNWALANGYADNLEIDRIDYNGDYSPDNCRWATRKQQMNNTSANHLITYQGITHTLQEWSEIVNIPYHCLKQRINKQHWEIERAFYTPVRNAKLSTYGEGVKRKGKTFYLTVQNDTKTAQEWATILNVNISSLDKRINKGWTAEDCVNRPFRK